MRNVSMYLMYPDTKELLINDVSDVSTFIGMEHLIHSFCSFNIEFFVSDVSATLYFDTSDTFQEAQK